jgi:cold shock protein
LVGRRTADSLSGRAGQLPVAIDDEGRVRTVPSGKVKWYDTEKGFGFLATEEGDEVFVHASALPAGLDALKPGSRVEFGIADGKRGPQALSIRVLDTPASVTKAARKPAEDVAVILEDLIKLLDNVSNSMRRGRYPDDKSAHNIASMLRKVADDIDA